MRQGQHDRHIGTGHRCVPFARAVDVVAQRGEGGDAPAAFAEPAQCGTSGVGGGAAVVDGGVLQRQTAETHQQIGVFDDHLPLGGTLEQVVVGAHHPGHDHPGGAEAVGVARKGIATKTVQEPVYLALGVVETSGTGPAIGTPVDRLVSVGVDDAAEFAC